MIEALYQHIIKNDKLRFEKGHKGLVFQKKEAGFPLIRLVDIKNAICYHKFTFGPNRSYNIGSPMEKKYT